MKIETKYNPEDEVLISARIVSVTAQAFASHSSVVYVLEVGGTRANILEDKIIKKIEQDGKYDYKTEE